MVEVVRERQGRESDFRHTIATVKNDFRNPVLMVAKELVALGYPVITKAAKGGFEPDRLTGQYVQMDSVSISTRQIETLNMFHGLLDNPDISGLFNAFKGRLHNDPSRLVFFEQDSSLDSTTKNRIEAFSLTMCAEEDDAYAKLYKAINATSKEENRIKQATGSREEAEKILAGEQTTEITPEEIRAIVRRAVSEEIRDYKKAQKEAWMVQAANYRDIDDL